MTTNVQRNDRSVTTRLSGTPNVALGNQAQEVTEYAKRNRIRLANSQQAVLS